MLQDNYFYKIFEASATPTVILGGTFPHIVVKEANAAYVKLTGRSHEELMGSAFFIKSPHPAMYLDEKTMQAVEQSILDVYQKKATVKTPVQRFAKPIPHTNTTETLYLEATNSPVFNADGEIDFIVRTLQNVTDIVVAAENEKQKDKLLIEQERFLNQAQYVARIGNWEIDKNQQFKWSPIHYELMEVELGTPISVEFAASTLRRQIDKDIFAEALRKAIKNGEAFDIELNFNTAKGNERWIRFTGEGEFKNGQFERMYGSAQDITQQKILQQQLIDFNNKLEGIIQTVDGVVFECDAQTLEFDFVSEQIEELAGYTPQECIHQPNFLKKLMHPDDYEDILKHKAHELENQDHHSGDYRVVTKDGEVKWVKVSISIINENGAIKWLRGLMMDITASKRISELERIEKSVLELNANPAATTQDVLQSYLQGLESIFPEMQCSIMQQKNGYLYNWVANSLPASYLENIDHLLIQDYAGSCGTAAFRNQTIIVSDINTDPLWASHKETALKYNLRACWSQPLRNEAGEVIATLGMYYKTAKKPTEEQLKIVDRTAHILQVILQHRHNIDLLEEANLLMEQSQEMAHFGSVQLDYKTSKFTWSKELFTIFGLDRNTIPSVELYYSMLHPEDRERIQRIIQHALETKEDFTTEERIIRPNGEIRHLKGWGRVKADKNGEVTQVISTYLDITENKKIQEELVKSESRLRSLVDSQTNYVIRIDFNSNYSYVNKKYLEDFAPSLNESLIGQNSFKFTVPEHRSRIQEVAQKCVAHPNEVFELELDKYANNGSIKNTFWHFVCLTNSNGEPREIQCIGIDISELKAAQNEQHKKSIELEKSEKRYNDLFHLSPQPMFVYDLETLQFLDVNQAAVQQYGYSKEEFATITMADIQEAEKPEISQINKQDFYRRISTHKHKNGEEILVDIKSVEISFKGKAAKLILAVNITEPITYLEALKKQNSLLSEIAWMQSHEVRAPLTRIIGLTDVLLHHNNKEEEEEYMLNKIADSASELDTIIVDIVRKAEQVTVIPDRKEE